MRKYLLAPRIFFDSSRQEWTESFDPAWLSFGRKIGVDFQHISSLEYHSIPKHSISRVDGLVLQGGGDLFSISLNECDKKREELESEMVTEFLKINKRVIGICRGAQFLCQLEGGQVRRTVGHVGTSHLIHTRPKKFTVNSYHSWGIGPDDLPPTLEAMALDDTGFVELFLGNKRDIIGLMWHPERSGNSLEVFDCAREVFLEES